MVEKTTQRLRTLLGHIMPTLDPICYKGQNGRIVIIGGSEQYHGAPYFAGMAALRSGADLVSIYTCEKAL